MTVTDETCIANIYEGRSSSTSPPKWKLLIQCIARGYSRLITPAAWPRSFVPSRVSSLAAESFKRDSRDCFIWPRLKGGRAYAGCTQGADTNSKAVGGTQPTALPCPRRNRAVKQALRPLPFRGRGRLSSDEETIARFRDKKLV